MASRVENRVERLMLSHRKLTARYKVMPAGVKKDRTGKRILEIETSLTNIKEHGREVIGGGESGVEVKVPTRNFTIKGEDK